MVTTVPCGGRGHEAWSRRICTGRGYRRRWRGDPATCRGPPLHGSDLERDVAAASGDLVGSGRGGRQHHRRLHAGLAVRLVDGEQVAGLVEHGPRADAARRRAADRRSTTGRAGARGRGPRARRASAPCRCGPRRGCRPGPRPPGSRAAPRGPAAPRRRRVDVASARRNDPIAVRRSARRCAPPPRAWPRSAASVRM